MSRYESYDTRSTSWDDDDLDDRDRYSGGGGDDDGGGGPLRFLTRGPIWRRILVGAVILAGVGFLAVAGFIIAALQGLPSLSDLEDYQPPVTSRVYAGNGALVAEFAREQRVFVPIEQIPDHVKNAFIAVEDARFFEHSGIDYQGLARAMVSNVGRDRKSVV